MLIFVLPLAGGVALGFARRGRLGGLKDLHFRALPLLWGALAAQIGIGLLLTGRLDRDVRFGVIMVAYLAAAAFLVLNVPGRRGWVRLGVAAIAAGWILNVAPIALNSGMPVSLAALRHAGISETPKRDPSGFFKHVTAGPGTRASFLGDVIPVAAIRQVVSAGDLVLALGIALAIAGAMAGDAKDEVRLPAPP